MQLTMVEQAHALSIRSDIHDIVRELNAGLGSTIVQTIAGVKDRTLPSKWAKSAGPTPRTDAQRRLRLGHRVWSMVATEQGPNVALAWMVGANPHLGESTPLQFIVDEHAAEVVGAAEAFIESSVG